MQDIDRHVSCMELNPMAIQPGFIANFETLTRAFAHDAVCIMECTRAQTGEPVILICAVNHTGENFEFVPFAEMVSGNPYELYNPPIEAVI